MLAAVHLGIGKEAHPELLGALRREGVLDLQGALQLLDVLLGVGADHTLEAGRLNTIGGVVGSHGCLTGRVMGKAELIRYDLRPA